MHPYLNIPIPACMSLVIASAALAMADTEPLTKIKVGHCIGTYFVLDRNDRVPLTQNECEQISNQVNLTGKSSIQESLNKRLKLEGDITLRGNEVVGINLSDEVPTRLALEALAKNNLNSVHFLHFFSKVDLDCAKILPQFKELRHLSVPASATWESDAGCDVIDSLTNLESVLFEDSGESTVFGNRKLCKSLADHKSLRFLSIPCDAMTNDQVQSLRRSKSLEVLHLRSAKPLFDGPTLVQLSKIKSLRELLIHCNGELTDTDLNSFVETKNLELLGIETTADPQIAATLKGKRPTCRIVVGDGK